MVVHLAFKWCTVGFVELALCFVAVGHRYSDWLWSMQRDWAKQCILFGLHNVRSESRLLVCACRVCSCVRESVCVCMCVCVCVCVCVSRRFHFAQQIAPPLQRPDP